MKFSSYLCMLLFSGCLFVEMASPVFAHYEPEEPHPTLSVYVDIDASTWKTRGRIFYDVEGTVLRKLASAGFKIVRKKHDPHALTLSVHYREEKGETYAVNQYGTVLRATFSLYRETSEVLWQLHVSETSHNTISGTPPYLDVLQKFDTNPYYFFIGGLLRKFVEQQLKVDQALLGLIRQVAAQRSFPPGESEVFERFHEFDHSMNAEQEFYLPLAMVRSIKELVRREDREAIPVLSRLLDYPNEHVRTMASEALGVFEAL